jgi:hypothetical protein
MQIDWLDVLKLTVPFVTAILMVWIKTSIETHLSRGNKQHALSRLISDELGHLQEAVDALKRIAESAKNGKLRLVSIDVSGLMSKFASDLSDLDARQAYRYSDLVSSVELVNKGLERLSSLVLTRAAARDQEVVSQIDRAIVGQSKITAVATAIPQRHRYMDAQALTNLVTVIEHAEKTMQEWPSAPSAAGNIQLGTAGATR